MTMRALSTSRKWTRTLASFLFTLSGLTFAAGAIYTFPALTGQYVPESFEELHSIFLASILMLIPLAVGAVSALYLVQGEAPPRPTPEPPAPPATWSPQVRSRTGTPKYPN